MGAVGGLRCLGSEGSTRALQAQGGKGGGKAPSLPLTGLGWTFSPGCFRVVLDPAWPPH